MKRIILLLAGLILFAPALKADLAAAIREGNDQFAAGKFEEATKTYEEAARNGTVSAVLFYNLGNAWFRRGDPGRAILNYERALALAPRHPEAAANLRLARDQARALTAPPNRWEQVVGLSTAVHYAWIGLVAFWLGLFLLTRRLLGGPRPLLTAGATAAGLMALAAAFAIYTLETGINGQGLAIIVQPDVTARVATADNARGVLPLPPGSRVKLLSQRGDWTYAALPNGERGWIPAKGAEPVRL